VNGSDIAIRSDKNTTAHFMGFARVILSAPGEEIERRDRPAEEPDLERSGYLSKGLRFATTNSGGYRNGWQAITMTAQATALMARVLHAAIPCKTS
jgi:hypothetical protein